MEQRYFIAIIPPADIAEKITGIKKEVELKYQSKAALRSPPHITLHMPFTWKEEKEAALIETLRSFVFKGVKNEIILNGFNRFGERVIFIDVDKTSGLFELQAQVVNYCKLHLQLFNQAEDLRGFHPHITVAFRDLRKKFFASAWEDLGTRSFNGQFSLEQFSLLKHDGKQWNVLNTFTL